MIWQSKPGIRVLKKPCKMNSDKIKMKKPATSRGSIEEYADWTGLNR